MSNSSKVVFLKQKLLKKKTTIVHTENIKLLKEIELNNEINKLKNPKKGKIYVHIINNMYSFYQFNGKEWDDIV
jgi:hypothetical protein